MTMTSNEVKHAPDKDALGVSILNRLSFLEAYESCHCNGTNMWKQALWNLSKGKLRQQRGISGVSTGAGNMRPDLQAQVRLVLVNSRNEKKPDFVTWKLANADETGTQKDDDEEEIESRNAAVPALAEESSLTANTEGLRQRKNADPSNSKTVEKSGWTVEISTTTPTERCEGVSDGPQFPDPLTVLAGGLPPREWRVAQQQAREALQAYVEAALLARRILQHE